MKVLWVGDAAVSSGFAVCTHAVCDALHEAGHQVMVLGMNYFGDPHNYRYPIFPCYQPQDKGRDAFGVGRLPVLIERYQPDVVVLLNDAWNVPAYMDAVDDLLDRKPEIPRPKFVGWIAVDAKNQKGHELNRLDHVVAWTQFGLDELIAGGYEGDASVVPLGVDHEIFNPRDRVAARKLVMPESLPVNAFIVGAVGRNQLRKRLDLTIACFADWVRRFKISDAYLYLHVGPTGDGESDLRSLVRYHGISGRVILCESRLGVGVKADYLANTYAALDLYLSTTQGEGWGLPCLEAMACGVPCIVPDWSGFASWTRDAAVRVPCTTTALTGPMNDAAYTIGGVPDFRETVKELDAMYRGELHRSAYRMRGLKLAATLSWDRTSRSFLTVLDAIINQPEPAAEPAEAAS